MSVAFLVFLNTELVAMNVIFRAAAQLSRALRANHPRAAIIIRCAGIKLEILT